MCAIGVQVFRAVMVAVFVGGLTRSAHAYLDPGTGSMILQVLLGGVAGLALAGKLYWHKLVALFAARKGAEADLAAKRPPDQRA